MLVSRPHRAPGLLYTLVFIFLISNDSGFHISDIVNNAGVCIHFLDNFFICK